MSSRHYFITGTDTDAGKTLVSAALLLRASQQGLSTFGLKPVAAGCDWHQQQWQNSDALLHQQYSQPAAGYATHNPLALPDAIAPHIAAARQQQHLTVQQLLQRCAPALNSSADVRLTEGAGGWLVPLNGQETLADFACALQAPVILVVGMKLGCINHALLTASAILASGLPLAGWVANHRPPEMTCAAENQLFLQHWFCQRGIPLLGAIPPLPGLDPSDPQQLATVAAVLRLPDEA